MASAPGAFYSFPWEKAGRGKYFLYLPFAAKALHDISQPNGDAEPFWLHMMIITVLRYLHAEAWVILSRCHALTGKYQINQKGVKYEQVDRENHWDDVNLLHLFAVYALQVVFPNFRHFPLYDGWGLVIMLLLHVGPAEFVYYWGHRALHHHYLYTRYHSHHHASFITEPISGSVHPFAEHLAYTAMFAIPGVGTYFLGGASIVMFYIYFIGFDLLNAIGHCNFEFFPLWLFKAFPPLKYLIYTPSYHSLHHTRVHTNFALFMPLYDYLYGTADPSSDELHATVRQGRVDRPDCVFLAHGVDLLSVYHLPFLGRWFPSEPYKHHWFMYPLWPLTIPLMFGFWAFGRAFTTHKAWLKGLRLQTWCMPRFGFHYFLPFEKSRINNLIEQAILEADRLGCKVFGLGALNKNENLNGGGTLFLKRFEEKGIKLSLRLVHGNTLTAAVILDKVAKDVQEVFLTGATSKLGRAVALYLCRKGVKVMMLTSAEDRFEAIRNEAPEDKRDLLERVTSVKDGSNCKTWIIGKFLSPQQQLAAPPGTHFHQFVVPPIQEVRKDCRYGKLAAMRLPLSVQGQGACEMTMERGCAHACHAGALVHTLEGWQHHEVGAIDPDRIDMTWEAALRHGFTPVD